MTDDQKLEKSLKTISGCNHMEQIETAKGYLSKLWGSEWDTTKDVYYLSSDPRPVVKVRQALDRRIGFVQSEVRVTT